MKHLTKTMSRSIFKTSALSFKDLNLASQIKQRWHHTLEGPLPSSWCKW